MAWEVWWALVLGFAISAIVQAWVPRERVERALAGDGLGPVARATALGAASSSCSYAAIAIAKSLFQKGASAASALAFQFASTNLVWELGLVLWVLIGWQFTLAEYLGGLVMIALMWLLLRPFVSRRDEAVAREHARSADAGHQHHAAGSDLPWRERLTSAAGVVGRRPQLPRRLADAVEGDPHRLPAGRLHRAAGRRLLQRPLPRRRARPARADALGRAHRPGHRRPELRLLGRQRPARRRAVVRRAQLRRRDGLHLRRPDRAADHPRLPQVLRHRASRCGSPRSCS